MAPFPMRNIAVVAGQHGGAARASPAQIPTGRRAGAAVTVSSCRGVWVPAGRRAAVMASQRGGRHAIVAATSAPAGSHGTSFDPDAVLTKFRSELEAVKVAALAFVDRDVSSPSQTIKSVFRCASGCVTLLEFIVLTEAMSRDQFEEIALAGEYFLRLCAQSVHGYVTADALIRADVSLDAIAACFWPSFRFPHRVETVLPAGQMRSEEYLMQDMMDTFVLKGLLLIFVALEEEVKEPWIQYNVEDALSTLKLKLEMAKFSHYSVAIVGDMLSDKVLVKALETASNAMLVLESILSATPFDEEDYKMLLEAGRRIMTVAVECKFGYLRAAALVEATGALRFVGDRYLPNIIFPSELVNLSMPFASDGLEARVHGGDKEDLFGDLLETFVVYQGLVTSAWYKQHRSGGPEEM